MINNRIIIILAYIREGVVDIYAQKKLDQIEDKEDTQDWKEFVKEIKTMFSDKSKVADAKWKIKMFKQEKKHIADFIIKFEALAIKAETDNICYILTKEDYLNRYYQENIGIPTNSNTRDT